MLPQFIKKDDPSDVSNYRPISLLNTLGKVLEKIVHKHVFNFFRDHNIITIYSLVLFPVIPLLTSLQIYIILFAKLLMRERKFL